MTKGVYYHEEGINLMPCNIDLSAIDVSLVNAMSREFVLKRYVDTMPAWLRRCLQMSRTKAMENVKLNRFEDLFGAKNVEESRDSIQNISLSELSDFANHPFKIHEDKLEEMVESIKQYGVLMPGIVRRKHLIYKRIVLIILSDCV